MTGGCSMHGAFVVLEELGLQIDPGLGFGSTRLAAVFFITWCCTRNCEDHRVRSFQFSSCLRWKECGSPSRKSKGKKSQPAEGHRVLGHGVPWAAGYS